jgi:hypothetical protein
MGVLNSFQIGSFIEKGFCVLKGAFTAAQAAAACDVIWTRMEARQGIRRDDPKTWPNAYDIEEHLEAPEVKATFTDRLASAIEELVGPGRWLGLRNWGFWPVNFHYGSDEPYRIPETGWHVDGNWFRHTLDCPKQGLLVIGLFTDIAPRHGGTIIAQGSHRRTARVLAQHPEGLTHLELFERVLAEPLGDFLELTGAAGDVVLGHPFLFHTRGFKHGGPPRIISNTEAGLREPLRLERAASGDFSVLERSIRAALHEPLSTPSHPLQCRF